MKNESIDPIPFPQKPPPYLRQARCKDPCDFVMRHGGDAFQKLIDRATPIADYKWQHLAGDWQTASIFQKQEKVRDFLRFLRYRGLDSLKRGLILKRLSELCGIEASALHTLLAMMNTPPATIPAKPAPIATGRELAEAWLIGCLLVRPGLHAAMRDELTIDLFGTYRALAARLLELWEDNPAPSIADVAAHLADDALVAEALKLERKMDDWQNAANLPNGAASRGITIESMARDVLAVLTKQQKPAYD
jgi:DNA primase